MSLGNSLVAFVVTATAVATYPVNYENADGQYDQIVDLRTSPWAVEGMDGVRSKNHWQAAAADFSYIAIGVFESAERFRRSGGAIGEINKTSLDINHYNNVLDQFDCAITANARTICSISFRSKAPVGYLPGAINLAYGRTLAGLARGQIVYPNGTSEAYPVGITPPPGSVILYTPTPGAF